MSKSYSIFLTFVILCACFHACGGDEEDSLDEPNPVQTTDGGTVTNPPTSDPTLPEPADRPPVAPQDFGAAPAFQLPDLDGNLVSLADYEGDVVIVNFWATWCAPCRREVPDFVEIQAKHKDAGLTILGISRDIEVENGKIVKDEQAVQDFVKQFDVNYPVLWDVDNAFQAYQGFGMPSSYILDRNQNIRFKHVGIADRKTLEAEILTLLNE